jgi:hypothetical protein
MDSDVVGSAVEPPELVEFELPGGLGEPEKKRWDSNRHLAESRFYVATWLLGILSIVLLIAWVTSVLGLIPFDQVQQLITMTFSPLIGLVGAATGFYFGERKAEKEA